MTTVGIHQPNYAPWLGYFRKMALCDHFVFLDDVEFSKGSVTNRVRILENGSSAWLTIPAKPASGTTINAVDPSQPDWPERHLSRLRNVYRKAPAFRSVWPDMEALYDGLAGLSLAQANKSLVLRIAEKLGIETDWSVASDLDPESGQAADDRLIVLLSKVPGATTYLSGRGGRKYQNDDKFEAQGITVAYNDYEAPHYPQAGTEEFVPGLSVFDAAFQVGWDAVPSLLDLNS